MERRMFASNPDAPQYQDLLQLLGWATNPSLLNSPQVDMSEAELKALQQTIKNEMKTFHHVPSAFRDMFRGQS